MAKSEIRDCMIIVIGIFPRDFDNLMLWTFIKDKTMFMSKKFKEIRQEFEKMFTGVVSVPARSLICSNFVLDSMEYAVGRMYVSNYFNNQSKAAVGATIKKNAINFNILLFSLFKIQKKGN